MVLHTRSAAKKIESGKVHNDDGMITADTPVGHPAEHRVPSMAKKRRRESTTAAPKKRRSGKPGEICQLNLDVLFLVRDNFFCLLRPFVDGRDVIDRCIRPPYRPPQPCTHMQISSTAPDGQILGVRMEDRSPPGQRPSRLSSRPHQTGICQSRVLYPLPRTYRPCQLF